MFCSPTLRENIRLLISSPKGKYTSPQRHEQPSLRNVLIAGSPTVAARLSQHRCSPRSPPSLLLASPSSARVALHRSLLCRAPTVERSRAPPQTPSRALLFGSTVRPFPLSPLRRRLTPACYTISNQALPKPHEQTVSLRCRVPAFNELETIYVPTVKFHLAKYEFVSDYYVWRFHGECNLRVDVEQDVGAPSQMASEEASNAYHTMVMDADGPEFNVDEIEESPNPEAQKFYDMLKAADQELWPGSKNHSQLSLVARLMSLKSENHISEKCFNQFTELMKEVIPEGNLVPENFYGWSIAGRLACPYCMDKLDAFTLKHSGKQSWFDNHRKFLPANHPFRKNKTAFFKNKAVTTEAPLVRSGYDILAEIETLGLKKVTELDTAEKWSHLLRYYVNGFKFHTIGYGGTKETMNSGVCIKGINYSIDESDYYGRLVEVVQIEYPGLPVKRTILFKCEWFDPTNVGMKVHSQYKLVEVNHKRRFNRYEPFVLAVQACQVYYCTYPSLRRDKLDWWAVCEIKARSKVEVPESSISSEESLVPTPFQEEITENQDLMQIDKDPSHLNDPNGGVIELDGEHGDNEDELELEEETDDSSRGSVIGDSDNGTDS
nr:uncharacterized protein LOC109179592 [Ipomoea batatas]